MKSNRQTTDGFVPRRPHRQVLSGKTAKDVHTTVGHLRDKGASELHTGAGGRSTVASSAIENSENNVSQGNDLQTSISQSLKEIDDSEKVGRQKRKKRRKGKLIAKIISLVLVLSLLAGGGFLAYKAWHATSRIFSSGNLFDLFHQQPLKKDANGRSSLLILGSTEDMARHQGDNLTDSMMVVSVDQEKKDIYMVGIPRDLWVDYGRACPAGYKGKINAFYSCVDSGDTPEAEERRMAATRKLVGDILGIEIQYSVHVNTVVIRDAVDAVGGVTVNVQSRDPRGVLDASFDPHCRREKNVCKTGHYLDFPNGPNKMNGNQALAFSRARGHKAPTYGLEQSNFDREKNQQLVLIALKDKATSTGTLTDFGKVTALMDAMGDNLRTNIDTKEIRTIMDLASKIDDKDIHRLSFVEEGNRLMTTGSINGASVVRPVAGIYDYSQIRAFIKSELYATPVSKERAKVAVLNGGETSGAAHKEADKLRELGVNVVFVGNAPDGNYGDYQLRQISDQQFPATTEKLKELYGSDLVGDKSTLGVNAETDFIIIIGK